MGNTDRQTAYPARLTQKSQVGVPAAVREQLALKPGDRGVWILRDDEAVLVSARRYAEMTAGILAGTYGRSPEEIRGYLDREREGWP